MSEEELEVRDQRLVGYYWIESTILKRYGRDLGPFGLAVYNALACFADNNTSETYLSAATIAEMTGMSERQVKYQLRRLRGDDKKWSKDHNLKGVKLVDYERRPGQSTLYTLITIEKNPKKVEKHEKETGW